MDTNTPTTFTCTICHDVFEKIWTAEEAEAEAQSNWGNLSIHERAVVCDDCYQMFMEWHDQQDNKQ